MELEAELERLSIAILAAEDWAPAYSNAPKQHAELIRLTAKMQILVMRYLRNLAKEAPRLVNWYEYSAAVSEQQRHFLADGIQAYNINVVINNDAVSQQDQQFIKVVFDTMATVMATGASSMETEAGIPIGLSSTSSIIQNLTTKQLANLVGMKVNKDGTIVPNPKPEYNIDETTRNKIAQSIKTSIQLGEDHTQAVKRLQSVIADANRADMISYTETVRAYAEGRKTYALQSGAGYKVWSDNNATDVCADNTAQGPIPIGEDFVSGDPNEPAHPRCRCLCTYIYADSVDEATAQWNS
ncbi:MAG TPA: hypothetical protein VNG51_19370 [Ktedonobacteraceae bacterium]|nr:hypothetical protein [Ktedonobacteraceae bacterium]